MNSTDITRKLTDYAGRYADARVLYSAVTSDAARDKAADRMFDASAAARKLLAGRSIDEFWTLVNEDLNEENF